MRCNIHAAPTELGDRVGVNSIDMAHLAELACKHAARSSATSTVSVAKELHLIFAAILRKP